MTLSSNLHPARSSPHAQQLGSSSGIIYVLLLEQDKLYIGYSARPIGERFIEHFNNNGAEWTKKYHARQVMYFKNGTTSDEDELTLEMMCKYGWWNVRGGRWCRVDMNSCPKELLKRQGIQYPPIIKIGVSTALNSTPLKEIGANNCFRCGRFGHIASNCYAKTTADGKYYIDDDDNGDDYFEDEAATNICFRCGRSGHIASECYAKTTADGKYDIYDYEESAITSCFRCGRSGHSALDCYAKITANEKKNSKRQRDSDTISCYRCGRPGHISTDCYATSSIDRNNSLSRSPACVHRLPTTFQSLNSSFGTCFRCGREGHMASNCYASYDSKGFSLRY